MSKLAARSTALYLLLILCALTRVSTAGTRKSKSDPVIGERIAKAIAFEGELWLRGSDVGNADGLISLNVSDGSKRVRYENGVVDIEKAGNELWVLRRAAPNKARFTVSVFGSNSPRDMREFETSDEDTPLSLLNGAGVPIVLSHQSLWTFSTALNRWQKIDLKGKLRGGVQVAAASPMNGGSIYVGLNRGEWGGGLQRVSLGTGLVTDIERRDTDELCAGPLNSDCDPVTGVIADANNGDCVLVSIGLVHMWHSAGRIVRVCGAEVTPVWEKLTRGGLNNGNMTEAVYGLASVSDGRIWAITLRALYQITADGKEQRDYDLPKLRNVGGINLSTDLPNVIVLRTDLNWAVSTSGYTPLLVPTEPAASR